MNQSEPSRRDLLRALRGESSKEGARATSGRSGPMSGPSSGPTEAVRIQQPVAGATIRLGLKSMACEFAAILNPGPADQISVVGEALEIVPQIESWLSIYRAQSEISLVNRLASAEAVSINAEFAELIQYRSICIVGRQARLILPQVHSTDLEGCSQATGDSCGG